uniref:NACHT domain- and WD repeat-containing protein 1 n=1 Tax=Petromyzon marinus TaxID=7757 RepID=A0AAJ7TRJ2_PETMA|nr:NACHT domain- and WD repeat-containing protein 1 [Petromyzon marinus]
MGRVTPAPLAGWPLAPQVSTANRANRRRGRRTPQPHRHHGAREAMKKAWQKWGRKRALVRGRLGVQLPEASNLVRVFLSSTFSDMQTERDTLLDKAYPELQAFCQERGLTFEVVDMRWGVRDTVAVDHMTTELCLREIESCQKTSVGPTFVALLGNRYGYRPLPRTIPEAEMEALRGCASREETEQLEAWFWRDANAEPPLFLLQPITALLPHFDDQRGMVEGMERGELPVADIGSGLYPGGREDLRADGGGGVSGISGFGSDDAFISAPLQDPSRAELQARDAALWRDTESRLSDILRRSAGAAMRKGLLSAQRYHAYLCSAPPRRHGVGGAPPTPPTRPHRAAECCSVFVREARGVAACVPASERARVFVDAERGPDGAFRVDAEAQALLRSLKRRLRAHGGGGGGGIRGPPAGSEAAPRARLVVYQVEWSEGMVDSAVESHRRYLDSVCRTFTAELKRQITRCVEAARRAQAPDDRLLQELGHHAAQCERKSRGLCGRAALMATLWSRLHERRRGAGGHPPVVVFGPSGTGKTSVLAELVRQAPEQLGEEAVVAARLLGTSPLSSDIHAVLRGLCLQLCLAYERERPPAHVLNVYADTVRNHAAASPRPRFFHRLLASVGEQPQAPPLLLVLDSLDQLSGTDGAHRLHWLPKRYAASVLVVVSTLPSEHGILDALRAAVHDADAYLEVEPLMPENGGEMMEGLLRAAGRTLAGEQRALLLAAFARCGQPLFVRLAFDEARRWRSFAPLGVELRGRVASDTREAVHALYARLEAQHGRALVAHALGFVVASRSGLSEVELKDCLSLDDAVLADVYQYWSPPNRDMVRLPPLLWTRLRHDLADYLVDRQADGHTVIALYHRQFVEAVQERYLQGEERRLLHQTLADYFGGSWAGGRRKTIHLSQRGEVLHADRKVRPSGSRVYMGSGGAAVSAPGLRTRRAGLLFAAHGHRRWRTRASPRSRMCVCVCAVAAQPLRFGEDKVNLRKLSELPFHLAHAGRHQQLREEIFGSVEWLSLKLSALGVKALLEDFALALELQPCAETQLVHDAMLLIRPTLEFMENGVDESVFFVELLARLEYFERRYPTMVGRLCAQCRQLCQTRPEPILLPLWGCLQPPGGPLRTTLTGFGQGVSVLALSASGRVMAAGSLDGTIIVWDLQEDEATHTLTGHAGEVLSLVLGRRADLLVSFGRDSTARVWSLVTGKEVTLVSTAPAGPNVPSGSSGSTGPTSSATAALGKEEEEDEVSYSLIVVSEEREEFHLFTNSTLHSFSLWSGAPLLSEPLGGRSRCHALGGDGEGTVAVVTAAAAADGGDADDGGCCPGGGVRVSLVEPGAGLLKRRLDAWVPGPAGPAGRPVCVAVAGPGLLLAGLAGGTLLTVSLEAGGCCRSTEALGAEPRFIAVSPDCTLAAVGVDKRVCVFDLRGAGEAPARRAVEPRHQDRVEAAVFSGCTALISASLDETIKVRAASPGPAAGTARPSRLPPPLAFARRRGVRGRRGWCVRVRIRIFIPGGGKNPMSYKALVHRCPAGAPGPATTPTTASGGHGEASCSRSGDNKACMVERARVRVALVRTMCDARACAVCGTQVWDLRDGLTLRECIEGMGMAVTALCLAADGILVSASRQAYYLKVWDVGERRLRGDPGGGSAGGLLSPPFHDRSGLVALTVDAATVVLQDMEEASRVVLWDTRTGAPRQLVSCPAHVTSVDCARGRDLIVIGLSSGLVLALTPQLDTAESGREGAVPPADAPWAVAAELGVAGAVSVTCLALGAGDSRLAVGLSSNRVAVHCTKTWLCQCVLEAACRGALSAVALLPGLAGAMWGSDSGQLGLALRRPPTPAGKGDREPASSPVTEGSSRTKDRADDGGGGDGGERCVELEGYGTRVSCVLLSPGGRYAFAGCDGTLQRLWCARTWQVLHEYTYQGAFYQGVTSAAFSPEERFLFTGSRDRSIKVWCVVTGILLKVQYVYATVTRVIAMETRGGPSGEQLGPEARPAWACLVLACTRLGYVLRLEFRCPPRLAPGYDPLRYIKASSSVCSRRPSALGGPCREQAEAVPEAAARAEWTRGLQDDHGGSGAVGATRGHEEAAVPGRRGGSSRTCALL